MIKNKIKIILGFIFLVTISLFALKYFFLLNYYTNHSEAYRYFSNNFIIYLLLVGSLILISIIYILLDKKLSQSPPRLAIILTGLIILSAILILVFPIGASDIFLYLIQARTWALHGLNPYTNNYLQLITDAFYPGLKDNYWAGQTSSYGPLFILITGGLSFIFKNNFLASILGLKIFFASIHLANAGLIGKTLGKRFAWLYAFNPLILFEFLINGHNEVLLIFFCLLSFYWLWFKIPNLKNSLLAIFFLTLGVLIKFTPIIILPFWGLALFWRLKDRPSKKLFLILSPLLILSTGFLIYLPFWQGIKTLIDPISNQMHFFSYLLSSPIIALSYNLFMTLKLDNSWYLATLTGRSLFLAFFMLLIGRIIWTGKKLNIKKILNYSILIMIIFYASFFPWLMPWYFTFLLLLLLIGYYLNKDQKYLTAFYAITFLEITYYLILR